MISSPRPLTFANRTEPGNRCNRSIDLNALICLLTFSLLSTVGCNELAGVKPASGNTPSNSPGHSSAKKSSKRTILAARRFENAFNAGIALYRAAENQRTLNPSVASVLTEDAPSAVSISQKNWEKSAEVFKEAIRDLRKSPPELTAKAGQSFRASSGQVAPAEGSSIFEAIVFYESKWRLDMEPAIEEIKRDFSSMHTGRSPREDPAVMRSDRVFE